MSYSSFSALQNSNTHLILKKSAREQNTTRTRPFFQNPSHTLPTPFILTSFRLRNKKVTIIYRSIWQDEIMAREYAKHHLSLAGWRLVLHFIVALQNHPLCFAHGIIHTNNAKFHSRGALDKPPHNDHSVWKEKQNIKNIYSYILHSILNTVIFHTKLIPSHHLFHPKAMNDGPLHATNSVVAYTVQVLTCLPCHQIGPWILFSKFWAIKKPQSKPRISPTIVCITWLLHIVHKK